MNSGNIDILWDINNSIDESCSANTPGEPYMNFHQKLVEWEYGSREVTFEYDRQRVSMLIPYEDNNNISEGLYANLWYRDLILFLKKCISDDSKSIEFYKQLLKGLQKPVQRLR